MIGKLVVSMALLLGITCQISAFGITEDKEAAKKEIGKVVEQIFQNLEKMDVDGLFQSYVNSPDFILFTTDGSMADYQQTKNHHVGWFKSLSSLKVKTLRNEYRFLSDGTVVCPWSGTFEMVPVKGELMKVPFAITFVFRKVDNHWKVAYQHTAALPPAPAKPTK
jgi:ketosteroid isomerase-like protein